MGRPDLSKYAPGTDAFGAPGGDEKPGPYLYIATVHAEPNPRVAIFTHDLPADDPMAEAAGFRRCTGIFSNDRKRGLGVEAITCALVAGRRRWVNATNNRDMRWVPYGGYLDAKQSFGRAKLHTQLVVYVLGSNSQGACAFPAVVSAKGHQAGSLWQCVTKAQDHYGQVSGAGSRVPVHVYRVELRPAAELAPIEGTRHSYRPWEVRVDPEEDGGFLGALGAGETDAWLREVGTRWRSEWDGAPF